MHVETGQHKGRDEYSQQRYSDALQRILPHGQVLLVEEVENTVGEHLDRFVLAHVSQVAIERSRDFVGDDPGCPQGLVVVPRGLQGRVVGHEIGRSSSRLVAMRNVIHAVAISGVTSFCARHRRIGLQEKGEICLEVLRVGPTNVVLLDRAVRAL